MKITKKIFISEIRQKKTNILTFVGQMKQKNFVRFESMQWICGEVYRYIFYFIHLLGMEVPGIGLSLVCDRVIQKKTFLLLSKLLLINFELMCVSEMFGDYNNTFKLS